jgi:hypothetical protein
MLQQRWCTDAGFETINTSRRQACGVQCTRLNYEMNAKFPLYAPSYKEFQYDTANDFDADDTSELDDMYGQLDGFASSNTALENDSPSVLHGIMEHMKASDCQNILNLQHDVEHRKLLNWRYRDLYNQLITPGKNQLLVPIIPYLDGTALDNKVT